MRITADLVNQSPTFINAVRDRELDLRGNKIPAVENLGATKDLNDTLDLTDNDLRKLDNFPLLVRLRCLLASNNRVRTLDPALAVSLPNLDSLVLSNNLVAQLVDLEPLRRLPRLQYLSLLDNPVAKDPNYRPWVIWRLPSVRVLDFQRVKDAERRAAAKLFGKAPSDLTSLAKSILDTDAKTFEPGEGLSAAKADDTTDRDVHQSSAPALAAQAQQQDQLRAKIAQSAQALAGVQRLESLMDAGHIAGSLAHTTGNEGAGAMDTDHPAETEVQNDMDMQTEQP
ncbi:U2 snRNP complex subunit [Tieghemiomyces parasiticus]|uniref:U2 small nuclear ribonucleoprotein A' n=1 Tax=Tieghemiomyces parasiticus TaxID=78921 RepID=A0A9W8A9J4_9FUNG|nr:U2 snRNP complex subunit [Tieghemiomyces parasiticus]